ncbi:MAG: hypothetical protein SFV32_11125 [Opitutaceae bacterium]|nr:hypothetical protein [Opitutaceae bacterium]
MAFKIYTITPMGTDRFLLGDPEPVRFSGKRGLVARFLESHSPDQPSWSQAESDWIRLVDPLDQRQRWIVFEQTEMEEVRLSRLMKIAGTDHRGQTELLLTLRPLQVIEERPLLTCIAPRDGRAWCEELALDGSPGRGDSTWNWCPRPLHIGSATVGRT